MRNTKKKYYFNFLKKYKNVKFDAIGISFVQSSSIVKAIKKSYPNKIIISKLENLKGLRNLKEIINLSDVIMIDRGDLAAEIGDEHLFNAIKKISYETKKNGKSLIIATENLESMIDNSFPTKSEIISLAFSKRT